MPKLAFELYVRNFRSLFRFNLSDSQFIVIDKFLYVEGVSENPVAKTVIKSIFREIFRVQEANSEKPHVQRISVVQDMDLWRRRSEKFREHWLSPLCKTRYDIKVVVKGSQSRKQTMLRLRRHKRAQSRSTISPMKCLCAKNQTEAFTFLVLRKRVHSGVRKMPILSFKINFYLIFLLSNW